MTAEQCSPGLPILEPSLSQSTFTPVPLSYTYPSPSPSDSAFLLDVDLAPSHMSLLMNLHVPSAGCWLQQTSLPTSFQLLLTEVFRLLEDQH